MPKQIPSDWSEDEHMLYIVLHLRNATQKNVDIQLCDVFIKVNCHPSLFDVDLFKPIDIDDPKTRCRVGDGKVRLNLKKAEPGLWHEFRATGDKAELRARRKAALEEAQRREEARITKRDDWRVEMNKKAEHDQWGLDTKNRATIENWELEEKRIAEEAMYAAFDEETSVAHAATDLPYVDGDLDTPDEPEKPEKPNVAFAAVTRPAPPKEGVEAADAPTPKVCEVTDEEAERIRAGETAPPLVKPGQAGDIWGKEDFDDTEEYSPDIRGNPGKIGIRFSERPRPGVPVRDRAGCNRAPPRPKGTVKSELPPMIAGDEPHDEQDPVWLKDKADNLMVAGDYQGAHNAYTEALKLATNARAFANRAVANLYLGNLDACIEDCGHSLRILDLRCKGAAGDMPGSADPQDQHVRACAEVRMGTAYLWLGAFSKAEDHFNKALAAGEEGLEFETRQEVKADLARISTARAALVLKEKGDALVRRAVGGGLREKETLSAALDCYDQAAEKSEDTAGVLSNRCFVRLRAGQTGPCLTDAETTIDCLKRWPVPGRAPRRPARPTRLDPPYLDDPTFKHPDDVKQGEVDWLMKHGGGTVKDLPPIPPEYEWVKDVHEKGDDQWIAVRKKMTKAAIDTIKRNTMQLQDVVYSRSARLIREQVPISEDTNKQGEGPSSRAICQATDYATKLEEHEKEREAEREQEEARRRLELEDCDLEQAFSVVRSGAAQAAFARTHPVEKTRRRLFVKALLRRAKAYELEGNAEDSVSELRVVLRVEPENCEAKKRLDILAHPPAPVSDTPPLKPVVNDTPGTEKPVPATSSTNNATKASDGRTSAEPSTGSAGLGRTNATNVLEDDDEDGKGIDFASISALLNTGAEYMKKNDYASALQVYNYARRSCKQWESSLVELKTLSNSCLCLQRLRGRLPELVAACDEVMERIGELRAQGVGDVPEVTLVHMESACLARRGSALAQLQRPEESARDAARVKQLMERARELEK
jgi:tetratricopeptide (TPR) repeat protein